MTIRSMTPQNDSKRVPSRLSGPRPPRKGVLKEIVRFTAWSLICFMFCLVYVLLLLWKADILVRYGLVGYVYYLVLLPLGLAVAGCLFKAMRSYGHYRGRFFGGTVELGGPVVGFLVVIILGFVLPQPSTNFPLTVFVHGEGGPQEMVLKGLGYVLVDIGSERRREPIGDRGQALFPEIPASFRGQQVNILLEADGYELGHPGQKPRLDGTSLYLAVRKKAGKIAGRVQNSNGSPLPRACVTVADLSTTTDSAGHFVLTIPGNKMQKELSLQAVAKGYEPWQDNSVVPGANDLIVVMRRSP